MSNDARLPGLELAVAKVSRVRSPRWLLFTLLRLRRAIAGTLIMTNRVLLRRCETPSETSWCSKVFSLLQGFLASIDDVVREADQSLRPMPLPPKIEHRARKSDRA